MRPPLTPKPCSVSAAKPLLRVSPDRGWRDPSPLTPPKLRPVTSDTNAELVRELDRRVDLLGQFFDTSRLAGHGDTPGKIRKYYEDSQLGYRWVHSKDGAMHMALNADGRFDRSGYGGQSRLVEDRFLPTTADVLELACGNGYNLELLAARHQDKAFLGLDLVQEQVDRANEVLGARGNAHAVVGNFQSLDLPDDSYDCVFVIESFCHATDLRRAFSETKRVLRPAGRFIVIDAWRTGAFDSFPPNVRGAAANIERAMAVADAQQLPYWKRVTSDSGFRVVEDLDLTPQIVPNLERLARIAEKHLLSHPVRARFLQMILPDTLLMNAISGYLMPVTVALGAHTYRLVMLEHA